MHTALSCSGTACTAQTCRSASPALSLSPHPQVRASLAASRRNISVFRATSAAVQRTQRQIHCAASDSSSGLVASKHTVPDGLGLEVLHAPPTSTPNGKAPLVFLHGSYHGAWCYAEKFLPYFAERGYDVYALSFRAQGKSDMIDSKVAGDLELHCSDVSSFLATLSTPAVLFGHSFGGLIVQRYNLGAAAGDFTAIAGVGALCSVPPSGNAAMVQRFLAKDFWLSMRITWAFVAKSFARSVDACREAFFSADLPEADLLRYQEQLKACSPVRLLDLSKVMKEDVPIAAAPTNSVPAFVLGGTTDVIVDLDAVEETAEYFGVEPVVLDDMAHDCMIDTRWEQAAAAIDSWASTL